eukprot:gene5718-7113_t
MGNFISSQTKPTRIMMVGNSGSGKTALLYRFMGIVQATSHTIGFNQEFVPYPESYQQQNCKREFSIIDTGGGNMMRPLYIHFHHDLSGVIFVVDGTIPTIDFDVVRNEFNITVLKHHHLRALPLLILVNKCDLPNSMNITQVIDELDLYNLVDPYFKIWTIIGCSNNGIGINESLVWLSEQYLNNDIKPVFYKPPPINGTTN